ncbi:MAG: DUF4234 domain-containing protein [Clostridia bacterium]|nr:DUF4234 domain-containing protein [Clostridia bacterium]
MMKKKSIGLYIFLSIITFGIYPLFFWYKWTEDVNKLCDGDDKESANYILILILNVFSLGINAPIWNYQMGERLFQKAGDYGVELKHGGMFIMFWKLIPFLGNFIGNIYKIAYINKLIAGYNAQFATEAPAEIPAETEEVEVEAAAE